MSVVSFEVMLGGDGQKPHLRLEVVDYEHPDVAEPEGLDLLACRVHASAAPVHATFSYAIRVGELAELRAYLEHINSGNGPPGAFSIAGGLLELSFAPSRRGPVLCAVLLKSIDASHVRLEFLVTLEPEALTRALTDLAHLDSLRA
ncbi:MAG: WapI family immunity protein [Vulcanimicrobiaceae bacterium]